MRLDGERIVLETVTDGKVAADAGEVGGFGDGLTEVYRNVSEGDLPITMGKWTSQDVLNGLRRIETTGMTVAGYLDSNVASGYLALLGASS